MKYSVRGVMVSMDAFQAFDGGSIPPERRSFFKIFFCCLPRPAKPQDSLEEISKFWRSLFWNFANAARFMAYACTAVEFRSFRGFLLIFNSLFQKVFSVKIDRASSQHYKTTLFSWKFYFWSEISSDKNLSFSKSLKVWPKSANWRAALA